MKNKEIPIVYIITKLELGGAQKVCLSLFNSLQESKGHAHLISGKDGPLVNRILHQDNVTLLPSMQREISLLTIWRECKNMFALIKTLRTLKKQYPHLIVHTHSTKAGLIGRWAAFLSGISIRIHTIHGFGFHEQQSWMQWVPIYVCELVTSMITTHFICVSTHDAKIGMRLFPGFSYKHSIIRAGVETDSFYVPATRLRNPSMKQPFTFGTISCFKPQKNLFDLLCAFESVYRHDNRARLEVIGDGQQRKEIEQWITTHNLAHVVTLHGWQHDVAPLTKEWHAFALSSLWEGLPCAIIEARLQHLPVISYATGGISEVIIDGYNGFLVEKGNWKQFASSMKELMDNQALYKKMQRFPDKLNDFEHQHMIEEHIALYKELRS